MVILFTIPVGIKWKTTCLSSFIKWTISILKIPKVNVKRVNFYDSTKLKISKRNECIAFYSVILKTAIPHSKNKI